jgi:hypothetical protein
MSACNATATSRLAGAAEAVPTTSFSATREKVLRLCLSARRLPQRRDLVPFRCGLISTHHAGSRLRSAAEHPQGLAWYPQQARTGGSVFRAGCMQDMSSMRNVRSLTPNFR